MAKLWSYIARYSKVQAIFHVTGVSPVVIQMKNCHPLSTLIKVHHALGMHTVKPVNQDI